MDKDAVLLARIEDRIRQSREGFYITQTGFLDLHEQSLAGTVRADGIRKFFYGGYKDAERRMLILVPDGFAESLEEVLAMEAYVSVIRIQAGKKLTHRDYLGSVLGLGIDRSLTGDILVREDGADMLVRPEIVPFLLNEYHQAGRTPVTPREVPWTELIIPERNIRTIRDTIPSLRLDNVLSSAFRISRADAVRAIRSGLVYVDHTEALKADKRIEEGSVLILRGSGKALLRSVGGESRKGRIWIEIDRYL